MDAKNARKERRGDRNMNLDGLKLEKVPPAGVPTDEFEIEVTWMHGDADHYTTESLFGGRERLDGFYSFVDAWYTLSERQRSDILRKGRPTEVDGWWAFVFVDSKEEYEKDNHPEWYDDCWPRDVTNDWFPASFSGFRVFYYDERGTKFSVERE